jgi:hypothetical protein
LVRSSDTQPADKPYTDQFASVPFVVLIYWLKKSLDGKIKDLVASYWLEYDLGADPIQTTRQICAQAQE